jgi:hypothetical protein
LTTPVPGVVGGDSGVFRSPAPLPTGTLIASCDLDASSLSGSHAFGLCEVDPAGRRAPRMVYQEPGRAAVEAAVVVARVALPVFESRVDEANGSTHVDPAQDSAEVLFTDLPLLATLLFSNTRVGRPIDDRVAGVELLSPQPPPAGATDFGDVSGNVVQDDFGRYFEELRSLGGASLSAAGSVRVRVPGGIPLTLQLTDRDGDVLSFGDDAAFSGAMRQREAMQIYPGERLRQSMPRELFDGLCGGCHGSISGRELDVVVDVDVLTSASRDRSAEVVDLR